MPAPSEKKMGLSPWGFVVTFGVVSLLMDVVYEGARSITGPFLGSLGASAALVGAVTAAGEATALALRLVSGPAADRTHRYWAWTIAGYLLTAAAVPALALPLGVAGASALILLERVGKAVRSPAKDTLISHAGSETGRGKAFAIHEALDQTGAFAGPLLVAAVLAATGGYSTGFAILAIPGAIAMVILFWLARKVPEPARYEATVEETEGDAVALSPDFWRYAVFVALTMAGYATFGLIGYHLSERGIVPVASIPVIYAIAMGVDAIAALTTGKYYDQIGIKVLVSLPILAGLGTVLSFSGGFWTAIAGVLIWGAAMGVQESTLRAGVADLVPKQRRATAYGLFAAFYGAAWFVGGTLLGYLYEKSTAGLVAVCLAMQVAALVMLLLTRQRGSATSDR